MGPAAHPPITVLRAGALGDVILGFPALQALRRRSGAAVTLVAPMPQAQLALAAGAANTVVDLDDTALVPLFSGTATSLPPPLRRADVAMLWLHRAGEVRSTLERLSMAHVYDHAPVPPPGVTMHVVDWLAASLAPLGVHLAPDWEQAPWLPALPGPRERVETRLRHLHRGRPYLVVHAGSGSERKNWPATHWVQVLRGLLAERDLALFLTAGPADERPLAALSAAMRDLLPAAPWHALSDLSLTELVATVAGATLYLGNDTGVTHVSAATGTPTIAVFGPTNPAIWRPRGPTVRVLGGVAASDRAGGSLFAAQPYWPEPAAVLHAARQILEQR